MKKANRFMIYFTNSQLQGHNYTKAKEMSKQINVPLGSSGAPSTKKKLMKNII